MASMKLWKRKLAGTAPGFTLGLFMVAGYLLHAWASGPLLPSLPEPVEPIIGRDWERAEWDITAEPADPFDNSSPAVTGAPPAGYLDRHAVYSVRHPLT